MRGERSAVEPTDAGGLPYNLMVVGGHQQRAPGFTRELQQE